MATNNCEISSSAVIGENVVIGNNCKIGNNVVIYDNLVIGSYCIIEDNVVLGHPTAEFYSGKPYENPKTVLEDHCIIRTNSVIYAGVIFHNKAETGTGSVVREFCEIGEETTLGVLTLLQKGAFIGRRVNIRPYSLITGDAILEDDVFIGAAVVTTNDNKMLRHVDRTSGKLAEFSGPVFKQGCRIGSRSIVLPGSVVGENSIVGAGALIKGEIPPDVIMVGFPKLRMIGTIPEEDKIGRKSEN